MSLGEYKSRGSADTRLLLHLNGNLTDSSGNGNNGSGYNITYVDGRLVKYAYFNTSGYMGYIQVPDHSSLNIRDDITVSVWFKTNSTSSSYIVSKWSSSSISPPARQYSLVLRWPDGFLNFVIQTSSGANSVVDNKACETNIWKYVTCVYDGSTLKLYVDGVLKNQVNATGKIENPTKKSDLGIGSMIDLTTPATGSRFNGYMDEVIIESRAWSHSEIKRYYTNTLGKFATI